MDDNQDNQEGRRKDGAKIAKKQKTRQNLEKLTNSKQKAKRVGRCSSVG